VVLPGDQYESQNAVMFGGVKLSHGTVVEVARVDEEYKVAVCFAAKRPMGEDIRIALYYLEHGVGFKKRLRWEDYVESLE
jgi:hypothetical protein